MNMVCKEGNFLSVFDLQSTLLSYQASVTTICKFTQMELCPMIINSNYQTKSCVPWRIKMHSWIMKVLMCQEELLQQINA